MAPVGAGGGTIDENRLPRQGRKLVPFREVVYKPHMWSHLLPLVCVLGRGVSGPTAPPGSGGGDVPALLQTPLPRENVSLGDGGLAMFPHEGNFYASGPRVEALWTVIKKGLWLLEARLRHGALQEGERDPP